MLYKKNTITVFLCAVNKIHGLNSARDTISTPVLIKIRQILIHVLIANTFSRILIRIWKGQYPGNENIELTALLKHIYFLSL